MDDRRGGLRKKVLGGLLLVGLCPLAGQLLFTAFYIPRQLEKASGEQFKQIAHQTAANIEFTLKEHVREMEGLAKTAAVREALMMPGDPIVRRRAVKSLKDFRGLNPDAVEIAVFNQQGAIVVATESQPIPQTRFDSRRLTLSLPSYDPEMERYTVAVIYPVRRGEAQGAAGWIQVTLNAHRLVDVLRRVKIGRTGHAMLLVDRRVVLCPLLSPANHPALTWTLPATGSQEPGWAVAQENGHGADRSVVGFAPVGARGRPEAKPWFVVMAQDAREMYSPVPSLLWMVTGWGGALLGLMVVVGILVVKRLFGPMKVLQEGLEQVGGGDLSHRIRLRTHDELQEIAETYNRMAERLEQSMMELRQAEKAASMSRFYAGLVYDLKSPIVGIHNTLQLLKANKDLDHPTAKMVNEMLQTSGLFLGIVNDLLDVYQSHYAPLCLYVTRFSLTEAIEDVIAALLPKTKERGIRIKVVSEDPRAIYRGDRRRIQRVLVNLIDNAVRYSPVHGQVTVVLEVEQTQAGAYLVCRVEDEGPGIPPGEMTRIFELLYRVEDKDRPISDHPGRGLGLHLCKIVVSAHGGSIWAENRPEGGAAFWLRLPLTQDVHPHPTLDRGRPATAPAESLHAA